MLAFCTCKQVLLFLNYNYTIVALYAFKINCNFFKDTTIKELSDQEVQLKEIIESNEIHEDSFDFVVSMNDGLIINTSNSIQKSMGYPKYMWQGRSFIDFIHPKDHISFISYVTSVLTDPCQIPRQGTYVSK